MMKREETRKINISNIQIGGQNKVLIQSMCNIKTEKFLEVAEQINKCAALGADLMRVSIMDEEDAKAVKEIKKLINIPLVGDIHFDYRLAILAMENGIDKIRINPGNIGSEENVKKVVETAKKYNVPIRVGVNSGSLDKTIHDYSKLYTGEELVKSAKKHIDILEKYDFHNIVISLKGSNPQETIAAYRLASKTFPYPLHLGITEAGPKDISLIRSSATLSPLLLEAVVLLCTALLLWAGPLFGAEALSSLISASEFHAPQEGHFPAQLAVSKPHSRQQYTLFSLFAMFLLRSTKNSCRICIPGTRRRSRARARSDSRFLSASRLQSYWT